MYIIKTIPRKYYLHGSFESKFTHKYSPFWIKCKQNTNPNGPIKYTGTSSHVMYASDNM